MEVHARISARVFDLAPQLGASAFLVFAVLAKHAGAAGDCWPSAARIAKISGLSRRTVQTSLAKLADFNLIEINQRRGRSSLYSVLGVQILRTHPQPGESLSARGGAKNSRPPMQNMHTELVQRTNTKNHAGAGVGPAAGGPPVGAADDLAEIGAERGSWAIVQELERRRGAG